MSSLLDLRRMRHFVAVAEELHFRRAAERLHISQPPLSQSIQALEQDLDVQLFERSRQRVFLTEAGRLLLERARHILAEVETTRSDLRAAKNGAGGDLRIGFTGSSVLMPLLHRAVHGFRQAAPGVHLVLRDMPSLDQIEALHKRELDLGILRKPQAGQGRELEFAMLCRDMLVVAVHESNPVAALPAVWMKQLREQAFVFYSREAGFNQYHELVQALAKEAAFFPEIVQEARDSSSIIGLVAAGLGVAIVPAALRCIQMEGVRFVELRDARARSALHVAHRSQNQSPATARLRALLLATAAQRP